MAKYNILIKLSAVKEIEEVPTKKDRQRISERIGRLADNPRPHGCEKLSGQKKYRVRQGRYRIVYSVVDQDLTVNAFYLFMLNNSLPTPYSSLYPVDPVNPV